MYVQGAVAADGAGNLLSGLAGTVPNTTYSTSVAVTELTGVGALGVGVAIGVIFVALAFLPKALGVVLAIPPRWRRPTSPCCCRCCSSPA